MSHRRISKKRVTMAGGAVVALAIAGVTLQNANASEDKPQSELKTLTATGAGALAATLNGNLGESAAGWYYEAASKSLVMNVVDEQAAAAVRQAGGKARIVQNTTAQLTAARQTLTDRATIPGTSWTTDPVTNKVVVTADRTVTGDAWEKLSAVVNTLAGKAELKKTAGEFKTFVSGGDAILGGGARCSLGFNVVKDGAPHFLTAGHCTEDIQTWADADGNQIGTTVASVFPVGDFGLVKYDDEATQPPSDVNLFNGNVQAISQVAEAVVGQQVVRSGSTTQVSDGQVTGLNATVNYGNGDIVNGLIQTSVCAEPGDSGGSLFADDLALGLTSGGSGNCTVGGETFFQPVTTALAAVGAELVGDAGAGAGNGNAGAGNGNAGAGNGNGDAGAANAGAGGDQAGAANAGAGNAGDAGAANAGVGAGDAIGDAAGDAVGDAGDAVGDAVGNENANENANGNRNGNGNGNGHGSSRQGSNQ
ncbi:S1 family peptidase [Streptomyces paludis]|uniref:S1 family peptidase n=1 Tax=Streptomyces paludis TaxID=2282738 RepID=A0A345HK73_9ACTN|nr:S1 family peptidase [Streptomyces paludis]AXG77097.1 S1 family peptidase [Streptomyces paludis]